MKFDKSKVCVAGLHEVKEGTFKGEKKQLVKGFCLRT